MPSTVARWTATTAAETEAVGEALGGVLQAGDIVGLVGDLGAGKTCFVRGVARGAGARALVSSPTFTLLNEYPGRLLLAHIDLYRLSRVEDLDDTGIDEYLGGGCACLIEWYDRLADDLRVDALTIRFAVGAAGERHIEAVAAVERYRTLLRGWSTEANPAVPR